MARFPVHALRVYEEDDETVLFEVSTDPSHQAPYLIPFDNYPEQEVDFAKGSASIGQQSVRIADVPTDPTDQDTGYLTGLLSDPTGASQLQGHRVLTTEDFGAGAETVLDGVIRSVRLLDSFAGFELGLSDIRERERKTKAFVRHDTATVLPRGVLNGYGVRTTGPLGLPGPRYPVPATLPVAATYASTSEVGGDSIAGSFNFADPFSDPRLVMDDEMREALYSTGPYPGQPETLVFNRWKLLWRPAGGSTWTTVSNVRYLNYPYVGNRTGALTSPYAGLDRVTHFGVDNDLSGATLPTDGQSVEVIVQYDGPVTEAWPLYLQDLTVGQLIRNSYRGDYSDRDPRIRYDEDAVLALDTPVRGIIKKPADDLRSWLQENAYPVGLAAPTLNDAGEISPKTYVVPDATVSLPTISDSNAAPDGAGWSHGSEDAINLVTTTYKRDFRETEALLGSAPTPKLLDVDQDVVVQNPDSIALLGEQKLELSPLLLRAVGHADGRPRSGDSTDETGTQVALRVGYAILTRFSLGGQYFSVRGMRTDSDIEALRVGDYAVVGVSWHPDYNTGERGANRLGQVVSRRNLDGAWTRLVLVDAGSANTPVAQPTLGTVTVDGDGVVSIPVTAPSLAHAVVEYAVNPTEPPQSSGLWRFLGHTGFPVLSPTEQTFTTPAVPSGSTVWVRTRGEFFGRRPSAYTTPVSVTATSPPRVLDVTLTIDELAIPSVAWVANDSVLGIRLHYEVHDVGQAPTYPTTVDLDVDDGSYDFGSLRVPRGKALSVQVEPWTGWTGSVVSGSAGSKEEQSAAGEVIPGEPWVQADFERDAESATATLVLTVVDYKGSVSAVEFSKREGSQSGDTFGAWSSAWDSAPSTPPFDGTFSEVLSVPGGEESAIKWRVTFTDKDGNSRTVGSTHYTAMIDAHETTIVIAGVTFRPETKADVDNYDTQNGYLTNGTDGSGVLHVSSVVPLPAGVLITEVSQEAYREDGTGVDEVTTKLYAWDSAGSTLVSLCTTTTDGWSVSVDDVNHTVDPDKWYNFDCLLREDGGDPVADARLGSVSITYLRHTQQENL